MDRKPTGRCGRWPKAAATFAALIAIVLNLIVPQGFMASAAANGSTLVLCTGSGPVTVAADLVGKAGHMPAKPDGPCAFAGHAAPTPLADTQVLRVQAFAWQVQAALRPVRAAISLRPAAPPPPAIGPPSALA